MKISVCLASYNGEKFIEEQILSILKQLDKADELIISDDNSSDSTIEIIKKIGDSRIRLFKNTGPKGYSYNFQNALKFAEGEIIFLSDQDDIWVEGKKEKMVKALANTDMVVSDAVVVDKDLNILYNSRFSLFSVKSGFLNNFIKTRYIGCCIAFNRNVYSYLFPFPENVRLCPHDLWITLVGEFFFKTELIEEQLINYRRHESNVSDGGHSKGRSPIIKFTSRIYCLKELIKHKIK